MYYNCSYFGVAFAVGRVYNLIFTTMKTENKTTKTTAMHDTKPTDKSKTTCDDKSATKGSCGTTKGSCK